MKENENTQGEGASPEVSWDKKADILQATFEHYYRMAMDHHTKAGTTSNILFLVVGGLLVLVGYDQDISCSDIDIASAIAVILIGIFGAVWVWKQHERYHYWEFIAIKYQKELRKIMPELRTRHSYKKGAEAYAEKQFSRLFARTIKDRCLWLSLHLFVMGLGAVLLVLSLCKCN